MIGRAVARTVDFLRRERGPAVASAVVLSLIIAACLLVAILTLNFYANHPPDPGPGGGVVTLS